MRSFVFILLLASVTSSFGQTTLEYRGVSLGTQVGKSESELKRQGFYNVTLPNTPLLYKLSNYVSQGCALTYLRGRYVINREDLVDLCLVSDMKTRQVSSIVAYFIKEGNSGFSSFKYYVRLYSQKYGSTLIHYTADSEKRIRSPYDSHQSFVDADEIGIKKDGTYEAVWKFPYGKIILSCTNYKNSSEFFIEYTQDTRNEIDKLIDDANSALKQI